MASSADAGRSRKRPREEDDGHDMELTVENAIGFAERMRKAVTLGTITPMLVAVERAGLEPRAALVAARGLRRFRQWLMELLPGAASRSASPEVSPKDQALAAYALKVRTPGRVRASGKTAKRTVQGAGLRPAEIRQRRATRIAMFANLLDDAGPQDHRRGGQGRYC